MITTHILDLSTGKPAAGVRVTLTRIDDAKRTPVGAGVTDADGRLKDLTKGKDVAVGTFELTFDTGDYFRSRGDEPFHRRVAVQFEVSDDRQHYHVPLLVSPFGYTTYRGS